MDKKRDFPMLMHHKDLVYCDSAATAQKPQVVIDAITHYYTTMNASVGRGVYALAEQVTTQYENVREKVAQFIGAQSSQEIVFTRGTTDGINFVATAWGQQNIHAGDEIVVTALEHHSNFVPWQQLALAKKAVLKIIPVDVNGSLIINDLSVWITPKTKMVAVTHVSNALGVYNSHLEKLVSAAHAVGARVLVDGCQAVGYQPVNVQELGADFYVFSGHKVYGPTGVGVLYIKKSVQPDVPPYQFGGGAVFEVKEESTSFRVAPHCYEPGTPPIAQVLGLGAALDYVSKCGLNTIHAHVAQLCAQFIQGVVSIKTIKILGDVKQLEHSGHLVSFVVEGIHAHDVAAFLDTRGICVRAGHHCAQLVARSLGYEASVRVSFGLYNNAHDVTRVIEALSELSI